VRDAKNPGGPVLTFTATSGPPSSPASRRVRLLDHLAGRATTSLLPRARPPGARPRPQPQPAAYRR
jgi:hypothetical protein